MPKLESLTIRRFRNVEPTTLRFHDRTNVLLGRNGSGKTTLLNLISMVLRSDFDALVDEDFDISVEMALSDDKIVKYDIRNGVIWEIGEEDPLTGVVHSLPVRFDEGLDYYRLVFEDAQSRPAIRRNGLTIIKNARHFPADLVDAISDEKPGAAVCLDEKQLAFIGRLQGVMGFVRGEYLLDVLEHRPSEFDPSETLTSYSNLRARFFWNDETFVSNAHLSYGQKRLLALSHYIACNPDFVVADELVNGLHHEWIEFCLNECGDRQVFLTSQNPLLFDYLEFGSPEELQRQFVLCSLAGSGGRPRMRWTQMSDEKATAFHGATVRGIQYISEILQTEGLW